MKSRLNKPSAKNDSDLCVDEFLAFFLEDNKVHPKSLISTFFGDIAIPHGGKAWVETISLLLEPLGVSNRLVRTSLFRLVEEQWLNSTRIGRKSYYQLSDKALGQTRLAERLIYHRHTRKWDGNWTLVFIVQRPANVELRNQLEQELEWIGFGSVSKHIYAHPNASIDVVANRVKALKLGKNVVCMRAENVSDGVAGLDVSDVEMAEMCFPPTNLEDRYSRFITQFSRLDLKSVKSAPESSQLLLRLLLIDEYRRIVLHDPHLPDELLPADWAGDRAHTLSKAIYKLLFVATNKTYCSLIDDAGTELLSDILPEYTERFRK